MYKTISFPKAESGTKEVERLRIIIPEDGSKFSEWLSKFNSQELRQILIDDYKALIKQSSKSSVPLSNLVLNKLSNYYNNLLPPIKTKKNLGKHGTFTPNRIESIHRWYPYMEGFSSTFVESLIKKWMDNAKTIFDPFAGTGTTLTVASINGIKGFYSEINPFMRLVIHCKSNLLKQIIDNNEKNILKEYLSKVVAYSEKNKVTSKFAQDSLDRAFPKRPFFIGNRLIDIVSIKQAIKNVKPKIKSHKDVANLALGSIGVLSSEMRRATDLRYRRKNEFLPDSFSVLDEFTNKVNQVINDIDDNLSSMIATKFVGNNALYENDENGTIDLVLTSPPYLNGTNYFRNTKIELWLAGFIEHERELTGFNRETMIAGINNVSKNTREIKTFDFVEKVANKLDEVAYDSRIPKLIRGYCSDTELWINNCKRMLRVGGKIIVDIGDSKFCGVHVPTDKFLIKIAESLGLKHVDTEFVRLRRSNDGAKLKQVLLAFEKVD